MELGISLELTRYGCSEYQKKNTLQWNCRSGQFQNLISILIGLYQPHFSDEANAPLVFLSTISPHPTNRFILVHLLVQY